MIDRQCMSSSVMRINNNEHKAISLKYGTCKIDCWFIYEVHSVYKTKKYKLRNITAVQIINGVDSSCMIDKQDTKDV